MEQTFTVHPMSQRFSLDPGKTYEGSVTVVNPADATSDFTYNIEITPYGVIGKNYSADLRSETGHTLIKDWIKLDETSGTIKPNGKKIVKFKIEVPEDAPPGGQYATIAISGSPTNTDNSGMAVESVLELASIVYGDVSGEVVHDGEILENYIPGFIFATPATVTADISNNGNVHEDASFMLSVKNVITGEKIYPKDNESGSYTELIMPETTKHIERDISNLPYVGIVKVSQNIYYNGHYSSKETDLIICPIWLLFTFFLVISSLLVLICLKVRKTLNKRKNKGNDKLSISNHS